MPMGRVKLLLAPLCWRLYSPTWRINTTPLAAGPCRAPVIFACLHRDILPAIRYCAPARPTLLVSKSPDGQILRRTLAHKGFTFVGGSTGHDGGRGFVALLRVLRRGHHVGLAVDGPRGPLGHVHAGALQLALRSGAAVVPLTLVGTGWLELRTWDRTRLPWPGARLRIEAGAPLRVPTDADAASLEALREELARSLGTSRKADHENP